MNIIYCKVIGSIIALILLTSCSNSFIQGQGFKFAELKPLKENNIPEEENINLSLVDLNSLSIQVLDTMPKISAAKMPADLKKLSFANFIDNSFPNYLIGPGDILKIEFPTDVDVNQITSKGLKVNAYGEIEFPYLGKYKISGFSASEAEELLALALSELYVNPRVMLSIQEFNSNKIYISGIMNGGTNAETKVLKINDVPKTIVQALSDAEVSFNETVPNPFLILKRDEQNYIVDLGFISNNADPNIYVKNNDYLYLPNSQLQKIYLTGAVNADMILDFESTMTLSEALFRGSINKSRANLEEIYILRINQSFNNQLLGTAYKLNYKSPASIITADNFYLLDRDIIFVSTKKLVRWNATISHLLSSLDFINLWQSYKPINSEVFRTQ